MAKDSETGLYYYGARYYDPRTSIWLSTDPLMEKYSNVNPYVYCLQNPVNFIDPTGMEADGWIKTLNDDGHTTYTYDATINSQADLDSTFPDSGKTYVGENFNIFSATNGKADGAYSYSVSGTKVTDAAGNNVDLTNNFTTALGSTIMNPENTGGTFSGFFLGGAAGGGISLSIGFVRDNYGDRCLYFTFSGNAGLGGGIGITSGVISPANNQTFGINDYNCMGNSWNVSAGFLSYESGGTEGDGFENYGKKTKKNSRPYIYQGGAQAGHYPGVSLKDINPKLQYKGIGIGGMVSSSKTWVLKL